MTLCFARRALALGTSLAFACGVAVAGKAHQHGVVKLDVAVDGGEVSLVVEMPLDNLVGFERAPRTDAERKTAAAALARMRDGASLFRFDAEAQCVLGHSEAAAPVLEQAGAAGGQDGHADLDATYVFRCAAPARLATLEVLLFDAFRRIERIEVQAVLPHGQRKAVLRGAAPVLRLSQ